MPEDLVIRPFRAEDSQWAFDLAAELGLSPWAVDDYRRELDRNDSEILVAADGTENLGFIVGRYVPRSDVGGGSDAESYNIGVRPNYQKKGIGSRLIETFIEKCRMAEVVEIWLEVRAMNHVARKFYTKFGLTEFAFRPNFYTDPPDDAIVMRLELRPRNFLEKNS